MRYFRSTREKTVIGGLFWSIDLSLCSAGVISSTQERMVFSTTRKAARDNDNGCGSRCIDVHIRHRYRSQRGGGMMPDVKQKVALSSIVASAGLTTAKALVGVMNIINSEPCYMPSYTRPISTSWITFKGTENP
jgi:hypothetical protein